MNIRIDEALRLLTNWKNQETSLQVHLSRSGVREDFRGTIRNVEGSVIEFLDQHKKVQVDVQGADFNGDESSPGYLVCEFANADRYSFYVLRGNVNSFP